MGKKATSKPARVKQKRLSPEDRRKEFVASTVLLGGRFRRRHPRPGAPARRRPSSLLYRYFPSKDDLIKEVYRTVYLEPLDTGWEKLLADRSRPIRDRLQEFYDGYTDVIFTRKWLRIYLYSGLKGLDINRWYVGVVRDKMLTRIIKECRHEAGLPVQSRPSASELEMAWVFHSGNLLLRRPQIHLQIAGARRQEADDQRRARCLSGRLRAGIRRRRWGEAARAKASVARALTQTGRASEHANSVIARSSCDEAIQSSFVASGLLRSARNDV